MKTIDSSGKRKIFALLAGVVLLLVLLIAITAPTAQITLVLNEKFYKQQYAVNYRSSTPNILPNLNIIPSYDPSMIQQEKQDQFLYVGAIKKVIKKKELESFLLLKIKSEISEDENINENSLIYTLSTDASAKETLLVYAETRITPFIDLTQLTLDLSGKAKKDAQATLSNMPTISAFTLQTNPSWLPFIPLLKDRIVINVN